MDPDATQPPTPREPNTPRTWIRRGIVWGQAHPDWLLAFVLGFIAGAVLL